MKIQKDTVVELSYTLKVDGMIQDQAGKDAPLDYIHGGRMLLPSFERQLEGLSPGDGFAFTLSPEEGYGKWEAGKMITLSKDAFKIDGVLHEELLVKGRILPMLDAYGSVVQARVTEITEDSVLMDFNHPMAGKTLDFSGEILSVREATEKELKEGLHGEYLPKEHCCHGKGRGCCGGGGKGGCCEGEEGCCEGDDCCGGGHCHHN